MANPRTTPSKLGTTRRRILEALAEGGDSTFVYLRDSLELSDGTVHRVTKDMKTAGQIQSSRRGAGRRARTMFWITASGRAALQQAEARA